MPLTRPAASPAANPSGMATVMEYFALGDLRRRMRSALSPREALRFAGAVAEALAAVHAAGVLHRDLKPGNVMLRQDGTIALIDFGLSKDAALALDVTDTGMIFGTPHYMGHGEPGVDTAPPAQN